WKTVLSFYKGWLTKDLKSRVPHFLPKTYVRKPHFLTVCSLSFFLTFGFKFSIPNSNCRYTLVEKGIECGRSTKSRLFLAETPTMENEEEYGGSDPEESCDESVDVDGYEARSVEEVLIEKGVLPAGTAPRKPVDGSNQYIDASGVYGPSAGKLIDVA